MEQFINSPFKFLDPYSREDADIFFGRDTEIKELYQHIHKNRLVLVYGTSGTGKTSIVQCGLMNRMEDTDWTPFIIRRAENINESLCSILEQAVSAKNEPEVNISNALQGRSSNTMNMIRPKMAVDGVCEKIYTSLKNINLQYLRPVYLIFDQFEELLIMGSDTERKTFISIIDRILSNTDLQFCNLLFIMREEFFAGLSEFEKEIPDFCDRRLRIEPMNAKKVEEVITRSCEKFNIKLQEGNENARQIISVLTEKSTVSLPYLQIYLDQLWRTIYLNTGFKVVEVGDQYPEITIDGEMIKRFGRMNDVLNRFIKERITVIQDTLEKEFPDIPADFVSNVLDAFVTPEGTKRPLAYLRINSGIWFTGQVAPYLQKRSGQLMIRCLSELEKNKILRTDGQTYELAHDVLAGLIDSRRTEDQRKAGFTDQQIRSRFTGFKEKTSEYLTRKELESYRPYMAQLNLAPEIMDFYNASIAARQQEEQDIAAKEQKLIYLKNRQKKMKWGWVVGGALLVSSTALYFYSEMLRREFNRNESLVFMGYEMKDLNPVEALSLFGPIKERVFGDDTMKVNQKLLESMQTQYIQGLFSAFNKTLNNPILGPDHIDIAPDGRFIVFVNDEETPNDIDRGRAANSSDGHNHSHSYTILNDAGDTIENFQGIAYAYFTNKEDVVLLSKKTPEKENSQQYSPEALLPVEFFLFNCRNKTTDTIKLNTGDTFKRFLHAQEDVVAAAPFSAFDSYRVRFTASGNIIIPFLELNKFGGTEKKVQVLSPEKTLISYLPSQYTITTSRDYKKILTLEDSPDGTNYLNVYNEDGGSVIKSRDVNFADFTEDNYLIWGTDHLLRILTGADTTTFKTQFTFSYAYGDAGKQTLILDANKQGTELINMQDRTSQYFYGEELVATNLQKNTFITLKKPFWKSERRFLRMPMWWNVAVMDKDYLNNYDFKQSAGLRGENRVNDTLWRRDLTGKITAGPYTHTDGIETLQYNYAKDELLILTKKNKLLILDKDMHVKTGLMLTANDRYGMSENGSVFYYVRDQYLSVFNNNLDSVDVFDTDKIWRLLDKQGSPINMMVTKQRRKDLGLRFK